MSTFVPGKLALMTPGVGVVVADMRSGFFDAFGSRSVRNQMMAIFRWEDTSMVYVYIRRAFQGLEVDGWAEGSKK